MSFLTASLAKIIHETCLTFLMSPLMMMMMMMMMFSEQLRVSQC